MNRSKVNKIVLSAVALSLSTSIFAADLAERLSTYGRVVATTPVPVGGLTAWTIEKNGQRTTLYSTADGTALFAGILWDVATGSNVSDALRVTAQVNSPAGLAVTPGAATGAFAMQGSYSGIIPESIKTVADLAGITEGKGGLGDTVFIIVDPRCPYSRKAYEQTRPYVKAGGTIKWIPTAALGDRENGAKHVAAMLQTPTAAMLEKQLGQNAKIMSDPSKASRDAMQLSLDFLFAAYEQNGNERAGVPVAFFIDHRLNKPRMLGGVSESVIIQDIFGVQPQ